MMKKRVMMMALSCVLVLGMMVGCGSKKDETAGDETASASETSEASEDSGDVDVQGFQPPFRSEDLLVIGSPDNPFKMRVDDAFYVGGMGNSAVGTIEEGTVKVGDEIQVVGMNRQPLTTTVSQILLDRNPVDEAKAGDKVAIYIDKELPDGSIENQQYLIAPGAYTTTSKIVATVDVISKEDGGSSFDLSVGGGYSLSFYGYQEISCVLKDADGVTAVKPGTDDVTMTFELSGDLVLKEGQKFFFEDAQGNQVFGYGEITGLE